MKYNVNPCTGCMKKLQNSECNINQLNRCVIDTATAFNNVPSNNSIRGTQFSVNWKDCMKEKMLNMPKQAGAPRDFSNLQINMAPRWVQVPHYYPELLSDNGDIEKSLDMCLKKCSEDSRNVESCKINCTTDYNSVVKPLSMKKVQDEVQNKLKNKKNQNKKKRRKRANASFSIFLSVLFIVLIIILSISLLFKV